MSSLILSLLQVCQTPLVPQARSRLWSSSWARSGPGHEVAAADAMLVGITEALAVASMMVVAMAMGTMVVTVAITTQQQWGKQP